LISLLVLLIHFPAQGRPCPGFARRWSSRLRTHDSFLPPSSPGRISVPGSARICCPGFSSLSTNQKLWVSSQQCSPGFGWMWISSLSSALLSEFAHCLPGSVRHRLKLLFLSRSVPGVFPNLVFLTHAHPAREQGRGQLAPSPCRHSAS
jgi:hypothetical protein